jgi:hypothetical protein
MQFLLDACIYNRICLERINAITAAMQISYGDFQHRYVVVAKDGAIRIRKLGYISIATHRHNPHDGAPTGLEG